MSWVLWSCESEAKNSAFLFLLSRHELQWDLCSPSFSLAGVCLLWYDTSALCPAACYAWQECEWWNRALEHLLSSLQVHWITAERTAFVHILLNFCQPQTTTACFLRHFHLEILCLLDTLSHNMCVTLQRADNSRKNWLLLAGGIFKMPFDDVCFNVNFPFFKNFK